MHHLALAINTLNFSTGYSKVERVRAGRFNALFERLEDYRSALVLSLGDPMFSKFKTSDVDRTVAIKYPQFEAVLRELDPTSIGQWAALFRHYFVGHESWGVAASLVRGFHHYLVEVLMTNTDFLKTYINFCDESPKDPSDWLGHRIPRMAGSMSKQDFALFLQSKFLFSGPAPWDIPSEKELTEMSQAQGDPFHGGTFWKRIKWRYSAVAIAIRFFKSIPKNTFLRIRRVVLHEDRRSVSLPECHALGLVPFCLQNPKLHIERRVNLWSNILASSFDPLYYRERSLDNSLEPMFKDWGNLPDAELYRGLAMGRIGKICCNWITEVYALYERGMPIKSFSLLVDGDAAPDQSSVVFDRVLQDAAWQVAQIRWYTENSLNLGFTQLRTGGIYFSDNFPQHIDDIANGTSPVRCNFPIGEVYDPEPTLQMNRHLEIRPTAPGLKWSLEHQRHHNRQRFLPSRPLPPDLMEFMWEMYDNEEQQYAG